MHERSSTIAEYTQHLTNSEVFTLSEALDSLQQFFKSKCRGCEDDADGLVLVTGIYKDESPNFVITLSRIYQLFSQLTVSIEYEPGIRSWLIPKTNIASTDRRYFAEPCNPSLTHLEVAHFFLGAKPWSFA